MTLKDLNIPDLATLEAMSDEEVRAHFAPFLEVCKPKFFGEVKTPKAKKKVKLTLNKTDEVNPVNMERLQALAIKAGFGDLNFTELTK